MRWSNILAATSSSDVQTRSIRHASQRRRSQQQYRRLHDRTDTPTTWRSTWTTTQINITNTHTWLHSITVSNRKRKCADTVGTVLVPWAGHFQSLIYFSNKLYESNFIKQLWETVMVRNYQNAHCSLKNKFIMLLIIIFHTLSFPMGRILTLVMCKHTTHHMNLHRESKKKQDT